MVPHPYRFGGLSLLVTTNVRLVRRAAGLKTFSEDIGALKLGGPLEPAECRTPTEKCEAFGCCRIRKFPNYQGETTTVKIMRNNLSLSALVLGALMAVSGWALAADADGKFAVKGAARTTCEHYSKAYEERTESPNRYVIYTGWLEGYLSALNERTPGTYDLTSFESTQLLARLVYANCQRDVSMPFFNIARHMAAALKVTRIPSFSDTVVVQGKVEIEGQAAPHEITLRMYKETVRRLQNNLRSVGYFSEPIDGVYGDALRAAMRKYQTANSLTVTGLPDQLTLLKLLRQPSKPATKSAKPAATGG